MKKRKYALVLSGGGFRGAFQLGAIEEILENGIVHEDGSIEKNPVFSVVSGVSVGALNGSFMAMDNLKGLQKLWDDVIENGPKEIYHSDIVVVDGAVIKPNMKGIFKKIVSLSFPGLIFKLIFNNKKLMLRLKNNFNSIISVVDSSPLKATLLANIKRSNFKIPFRMGIVSLQNGEYYSPDISDFDTDEELAKAVLASAALPSIFPYIDELTFRNKGEYITLKSVTDGGVRNISPLKEVIDYIKTNDSESDYHIVMINCIATKEKCTENAHFNVANYTFRVTNDLMCNEILKNDYSTFLTINKIVKDAYNQGVVLKDENDVPMMKFDFTFIQPGDPNIPHLDIGDTLDASKETLIFRRKYGRNMVKAAFETRRVKNAI